MALAQILSTMREIILDEIEIPQDLQDRQSFFLRTYPKLSPQEAEDFAKIDPAQFRIYSNSIFVGEKNLIANNFPMTTALLARHWEKISARTFRLIDLVRELHRFAPWKSTTTIALCKNFASFLHQRYPALFEIEPCVSDLLTLELLTRKLKRAPDDPKLPHLPLRPSDLSALTVETILESSYYLPAPNEFIAFEYDVVAARDAYLGGNGVFPESVAARSVHAVASRNLKGYVRWGAVSPELYRFLEAQPRGIPRPMEELAVTIVSVHASESPETEQLTVFLHTLSKLLDQGVLQMARPRD